MSEREFGNISDAVCIDTNKIYDSCMDRDCIDNLRVFFCEADQQLIDNATSVRVKCAQVADVKIDVEPVTFNRGYYSCDITFYFALTVEVTSCNCHCPHEITGLAAHTKKVILCGNEGSVKTFTSTQNCDNSTTRSNNLPKCTVQCVDPVVLDSKLSDCCGCCNTSASFTEGVLNTVGGEVTSGGSKILNVTLGLFSIVQLTRSIQLLIPMYDYCVPRKECDTPTSDDPCALFSRIDFPTEEFFPPSCDSCCSNTSDNCEG